MLTNFVDSIRQREKQVISFFVLFYVIGVAGIAFPLTREIFIALTPFALLFTFALLMVFHRNKIDAKTIGVFAFIYIFGFLIEIIGVQSGLIFGNYHYGDTLGIMLLNTPLLIGLNWLLVAYISASLISRYKLNAFLYVVSGAAIMVLYDVVLEQIAPILDMWHWKDNIIPLQNYVAWFVIGAIFHAALRIFRIDINSPLARAVFFSHVGFFIALYLLFTFVIK